MASSSVPCPGIHELTTERSCKPSCLSSKVVARSGYERDAIQRRRIHLRRLYDPGTALIRFSVCVERVLYQYC